MDFTMLRPICRGGWLAGGVRDYINSDSAPVFVEALRILFPEAIAPSTPVHYSNGEAAQHNSKGVLISPEICNAILERVNSEPFSGSQ
jgi:hypothetical protein